MHLAMLQLDPVWEDKMANHDKVSKLLQKMNLPKDSLLILPEMFDTGFSMNSDATAQSDDRESETFLARLAAEHGVAVLAGTVGPAREDGAPNEAVAFAPDGRELVRYRKQQPFTLSGEDRHYGAGDGHCIFEWQGVKIAPFICYDLRFPEVFRPAAMDGAELIVVIACWPEARSEHWVRLLQARAIENLAFTVGVNRCGSDPTLNYDGRSTAFSPMGVSLVEADAREQLLEIDIDPAEARQWRAKFPALRDIRHIAVGAR